ncbi:MAG: FAD-dependent oxidoreductase [Pyrinomonadaceae bacterium]|nr:FAD-dependent oxidoreductase [Pyrinomonadaceae bacterium]
MTGYDLIVIGGGSAGLVAAVGAAELGARVCLIEKRALGGDCLYTGCVPSKTLIRSARFAAEVRRAEDFGFAPLRWQFKEPGFASVTDRVQRVIKIIEEHDAPERFRRMGVDIIFGTPRFISPDELEVEEEKGNESNKRVLRARRFCIATGSRPSILPIEGLKETGFITNEEVFHLKKLPRSLVVLGAGPIGLELAQCFARFGSRVTVVEMAERVLPKEDEDVSTALGDFLRIEGLEILLRTKAVGARRDNDGQKVLTIEDGDSRRELRAEEILVATGRAPNIEGLNLEAIGVRHDARRIVTDSYLRTTRANIFAAGDVTGNYPFTHMAAYEAALVVRNALFFWPLMKKTDFRVVPWATYTDPEVARVGLTEAEAREKYGDEKVRVYRSTFDENDRAQAEGETKGFAKLVCVGRKDEIVGAHIIGAHAGELIHEVVLAMKERLSASALGGMIHVYPTLTQVTQRAGLDAVLANLRPFRKYLARYFAWRR